MDRYFPMKSILLSDVNFSPNVQFSGFIFPYRNEHKVPLDTINSNNTVKSNELEVNSAKMLIPEN